MILTALTMVLASTPVKVRVDGEGYLRFIVEGRIVYSQAETLVVKNGVLASAKGAVVTPSIRIPGDVQFKVSLDGTVTASGSEVGHLVVALFDSRPFQAGQFLASSYRAKLVNPGEAGAGVIRMDGEGKATTPTSTIKTNSSANLKGAKLIIAVPELIEVSGDQVTLGDLGVKDVQLAPTTLFNSPPVGVSSPLTQYRLDSALKQANIEAMFTLPRNAVIRRRSQVIKREAFNQAATQALLQKLGVELPVNVVDNSGDFTAPDGPLELKAESFNSGSNTFMVTLGIYVEGKRINSRTVSLRADQTAVRVEANSKVTVVMRSAGLSVEVNAKARTSGFIGQNITVVTDTGTILEGKIIAADKVEVNI